MQLLQVDFTAVPQSVSHGSVAFNLKDLVRQWGLCCVYTQVTQQQSVTAPAVMEPGTSTVQQYCNVFLRIREKQQPGVRISYS